MADFPAFMAEKLKYNLAIGEALSCESNLTDRPYGKNKIRPSTLAEIFKWGCLKSSASGLDAKGFGRRRYQSLISFLGLEEGRHIRIRAIGVEKFGFFAPSGPNIGFAR